MANNIRNLKSLPDRPSGTTHRRKTPRVNLEITDTSTHHGIQRQAPARRTISRDASCESERTKRKLHSLRIHEMRSEKRINRAVRDPRVSLVKRGYGSFHRLEAQQTAHYNDTILRQQEEEEEAEMKNMKPPPLPPPPRIRDLETGYDAGWLHANSERTSTALSPIKPNSSLFGGHRRTDTTPRSDPMAPPNVDEYQEGGRLGILRAIPADPPLPPEDVAVSSKKLASTTQLARQRKSEKMEKNGASSFPEDASLSNERIGGTENDNLRRIIMAHVVQILSDQGPYIGWKALVPISVRAMNVWQIIASLLSMKPRLDIQACAQAALSFEKRAFQRSNGNSGYYKECREKLLHIANVGKRQQRS